MRLIDADKLIEALPTVKMDKDKKVSLYATIADFMILISTMPTELCLLTEILYL